MTLNTGVRLSYASYGGSSVNSNMGDSGAEIVAVGNNILLGFRFPVRNERSRREMKGNDLLIGQTKQSTQTCEKLALKPTAFHSGSEV